MNNAPPLILRGKEVNGFAGLTIQNVPVVSPRFAGMLLAAAWKDPHRLVARIHAPGENFSAARPVLPAEYPYPAEKGAILLQTLETSLGSRVAGIGLFTRTTGLPMAAVHIEVIPLSEPNPRYLDLLVQELLPTLAEEEGIHASAHRAIGGGSAFSILVLAENLGEIVAEDDPRLAP